MAKDLLTATDVSMVFGGLKAIVDFNVHIKNGELLGLIGPNGAGKTTAFNLFTGVYQPTTGEILFKGKSIVGLAPYQITERGIARTFQNIRLFGELSVLDNVKIAYHCHMNYGLVASVLRLGSYWEEEKKLEEEAYRLLEIFHLADTAEEKAKSTSDNVFNTIPSPFTFEVKVYESKAQFLQSNKSSEFIGGEDEGSQQSNYIKLGSVLHAVFAQIRTLADVPNVLGQLEQDGVLYDSDLTKEKLIEMLNKRFADKRVKDWFSDGWKLFNECSILSVDPVTNAVVTHRPDRVITNGEEMRVIDFKFGKPKEEHHAQVASYMALLDTMGYKQVSGYLWYVYSNKIEEVK